MNSKLYFSILKYIPSIVRMESINVGIVVHSPVQHYSQFFKTKNLNRVKAFDDEYNKDFFKMVMESLEYEFNYGKLSNESVLDLKFENDKKRFSDISQDTFLEYHTSYLVNEFKFTPPQYIETNKKEIEEDIENLKNMYLYYDKPKDKRISREIVKRLLGKKIRTYKLRSVQSNPIYKDNLGMEIKYDYKINDNTLLKAMTFDYKRVNDLEKELKVLLYDLTEITYNDIANIFLVKNDGINGEDYIEIYNNFIKQINKVNKEKKSEISVLSYSELEDALNRSVVFNIK